jgi:hypothetical protein
MQARELLKSRPILHPKKPSRSQIDAFSAEIRAMRKILGQARWARGTQIHRLNAVGISPLNFRPRLWLTFQPVPKEERSVLNGVGYALVCTPPPMLKSRGNRNQIAPRAQRAAPVSVTVLALERGRARLHRKTPLGKRLPLGFFGEGMPRAAGEIPPDAATALQFRRVLVA